MNRYRCPKGWNRLDGSCYYLAKLTTLPSQANISCANIYSNRSQLIQVQNPVEFFYAAHVLTRNNLSSLMIEVDRKLVQSKKIILLELLLNCYDSQTMISKIYI